MLSVISDIHNIPVSGRPPLLNDWCHYSDRHIFCNITCHSWVLYLALKFSIQNIGGLTSSATTNLKNIQKNKMEKSNIKMGAEKPTKCCLHIKYDWNNRQCLQLQIKMWFLYTSDQRHVCSGVIKSLLPYLETNTTHVISQTSSYVDKILSGKWAREFYQD